VPDAIWPLSANILDPVRLSLICHSPAEVVEVVRWFIEAEDEGPRHGSVVDAEVGEEVDAADGEGRAGSLGAHANPDESVESVGSGRSRLSVAFVKNRFAMPREQIPDGYRDVKLFALFTDAVSGLSIIGEIQIHDYELHQIKLQMHKLYKVVRAKSADMVN